MKENKAKGICKMELGAKICSNSRRLFTAELLRNED